MFFGAPVLNALDERVKALEEHADRNEQYTGRSNLLFSGIPEDGPNEDTDQMILDVINKKMEMMPPLKTVDIERSHRLGKKRDDRDRPIIVRFCRDRLHDQVIRSRSKLKTPADRGDVKPIYVNEDQPLTKNTQTVIGHTNLGNKYGGPWTLAILAGHGT